MSKTTGRTNWECDRCGRKAETNGEAKPIGWGEAELHPMGQDRAADDAWDLCDGCALMLRRLLQPLNKPDNGVLKRMTGQTGQLTEAELIRGYQGGGE